MSLYLMILNDGTLTVFHASAASPGSNLSLVPEHLTRRIWEERFVDVVEEPMVKVEESSTKVQGIFAF